MYVILHTHSDRHQSWPVFDSCERESRGIKPAKGDKSPGQKKGRWKASLLPEMDVVYYIFALSTFVFFNSSLSTELPESHLTTSHAQTVEM
jgi:hypothetical protein